VRGRQRGREREGERERERGTERERERERGRESLTLIGICKNIYMVTFNEKWTEILILFMS
jgi:hypothetical protein